jgi:Mannosyl-glycoprotein endo-beta-N-acetylglucosaminidase
VPLHLDSSLAFRPNLGPTEREATREPSETSAAFSRVLAGAADPARPTAAGAARQVVPTRTPLSGSEAADALEAAWHGAVGRPPSEGTLSILVGQWAHETGRGASMLNYNFGGIKGTGPSGATTVYLTHEGSGASEVQIRDRFRAYDSAEQGASDYLGLLQRRYPEALQAAERGDPVAFVQALKSGGYFTGDETAYTKSVASLAQRALQWGFDALGGAQPAAAPGAFAAPAPVASATRVDPPGAQGAPPAGLALSWKDAAPAAYAASFADEVGRVELLLSALRIGQLDDRES